MRPNLPHRIPHLRFVVLPLLTPLARMLDRAVVPAPPPAAPLLRRSPLGQTCLCDRQTGAVRTVTIIRVQQTGGTDVLHDVSA